MCPNCNIPDFKQLPPASSRAPFIVHAHVIQHFDFRCLRENRRVVQDESRRAELDCFHTVLTDISQGVASNEVRDFLIDAYVRGYQNATAENVPFEGSTAVFTRRRYRDKWNRTVVRRVSKKHNHSIKIKACVRPRGTRSQQWYTNDRVAYLRKKCRTQSLWNLHLAGASMRGVFTCLLMIRTAGDIMRITTPLHTGDFHHSMETKPPVAARSHMMRVKFRKMYVYACLSVLSFLECQSASHVLCRSNLM